MRDNRGFGDDQQIEGGTFTMQQLQPKKVLKSNAFNAGYFADLQTADNLELARNQTDPGFSRMRDEAAAADNNNNDNNNF